MIKIEVERLNFLKSFTGLLFEMEGKRVYFETRWGIHTFFMKYPIDVLVLNKKSRVVAFKKDLKPNRIFVWNMLYKRVLELPSGFIASHNISNGTLIKIVFYDL